MTLGLPERMPKSPMRSKTSKWAVYGPAIQNALGDHLSAKQIEALDALLGTLIEKSAAE